MSEWCNASKGSPGLGWLTSGTSIGKPLAEPRRTPMPDPIEPDPDPIQSSHWQREVPEEDGWYVAALDFPVRPNPNGRQPWLRGRLMTVVWKFTYERSTA